ncbi:hypothetical protein LMG29739_02284 [Paraburkholderia solisilvae]|uniref:Transmembrane protein n=1 Tax=Paraburkholderia solisilvae TaxID=624376 RepID=A0A6J5DN63_9BURK|nr:hypothetical protein LMG29739_02284 [Paraburkholderia solisilvae]
MNEMTTKRKVLYRKYLFGYLCLLGFPIMILALSLSKGAGIAGLVPGIPFYVLVLGGATYKFIKELRALKSEGRMTGRKSE